MQSSSNQAAVVDHQHPVHLAEQSRAARQYERGQPGHPTHLRKPLGQEFLGDGVDRSTGVVQDEYGWFGQQRTR
jgi:hypothetical protein